MLAKKYVFQTVTAFYNIVQRKFNEQMYHVIIVYMLQPACENKIAIPYK